jgi:hypothetical protein
MPKARDGILQAAVEVTDGFPAGAADQTVEKAVTDYLKNLFWGFAGMIRMKADMAE